jgi:hypothetical protein
MLKHPQMRRCQDLHKGKLIEAMKTRKGKLRGARNWWAFKEQWSVSSWYWMRTEGIQDKEKLTGNNHEDEHGRADESHQGVQSWADRGHEDKRRVADKSQEADECVRNSEVS